MTHTHPDPPQEAVEPAAGTWRHVLDALHVAGADLGANAADWWAQDTVGGRASGDTAATARLILAGLDDGDPLICDALPGDDLPGQDRDTATAAQVYADTAPHGAPGWDTLDDQHQAEAIATFCDGYDTGLQDRVAEHCRLALPDDDATRTVGTRRPVARRGQVPASGDRRR